MNRIEATGATGRVAAMVILISLATPIPTRAQSAAPAPTPAAVALPATIPIFPLPEVVLFPNIDQPLYIFEGRYREMVADALAGDRVIGMVMLQPGYETDYEGRPPVHAIGCAGTIVSADRAADGTFTIVLKGTVRFRIVSEDTSKSYRLARVEVMPESGGGDPALLAERRERLVALLDVRPRPGIADEDVVNALARFAPLDPLDRQQLLELDGALARSETLIELLEARR
jgi:hypothetical protein